MSEELQTVSIAKVPGVTERKAIALARARLEMMGLKPADEPEATAELIHNDDGSEAWQVSLPIETSE
jgi:hypothetical protein